MNMLEAKQYNGSITVKSMSSDGFLIGSGSSPIILPTLQPQNLTNCAIQRASAV